MNIQQCPKCKGDGLIGAGDKPWEKVGATRVCDLCGGTGKIESETENGASDSAKDIGSNSTVGNTYISTIHPGTLFMIYNNTGMYSLVENEDGSYNCVLITAQTE